MELLGEIEPDFAPLAKIKTSGLTIFMEVFLNLFLTVNCRQLGVAGQVHSLDDRNMLSSALS